jgi:hypothetical protein
MAALIAEADDVCVWEELPCESYAATTSTSSRNHGEFAPAVLQRRLQAMGDLAERELTAINQSSEARFASTRKVWGHQSVGRRGVRQANHEQQEDALAIADAILKHGGKKVGNLAAATRELVENQMHANLPKPSTPRTGSVSSGRQRRLRDNRQLNEVSDENMRCESDSLNGGLPSLLSVESRTSAVESRMSASVRASPVPVRTSPAALEHGCEGSLPSKASWFDPALNGSLEDSSSTAAIVIMYKRMLAEETNNGLMGGPPVLSDKGHLPDDLRSLIAHGLRQVGPWKSLYRRSLSPLASRSPALAR